MKITAREIATACGGRLLCGSPQTEVTSVVTDSRQVREGSLFVPVQGEKADAHRFIRAAFESGATVSLTEEHTRMEDTHAWIAVDSTRKALQEIAAAYRERFCTAMIGITGSVGKTTTKELTALALSAELCVLKTKGNLNSQIGLPLMLFEMEEKHQAAVLEMGMSDFGEMSRLAKMVQPQYAVITNIGISHIQQLKTRENILKEKLHITDCFQKDSVLFLNGEDEMLAALRGRFSFPTVYFGLKPWCDFRAEDIQEEGNSIRFRYIAPGGENGSVTLPVLGVHHVLDALAGLALAQWLGVPLPKAAEALSQYQPLAMRMQIHTAGGVTIIDDSYNASPDSARSSLNVLSGFHQGRRTAVLADMLELGEYSEQAHFSVGVMAARSGVDFLVTVGERAKTIEQGARSVNPALECRTCTTNRQALEELNSYLAAGDAVLIKGSRGMKTEEIVNGLLTARKS